MVNIRLIYQDDCLLVVDKPPNLIVESAESVREETLADILQRQFNIKLFRGGIVHRLDKDTSGLLLVAKTQDSLENLQNQFKERKIKKEYMTLVHGFLVGKGKIAGSIGRNPKNREKFTVFAEGKEAVTEYEPVKLLVMSSELIEKIFKGFNKIQLRKLRTMNYEQFSLVVCRPKTGRTHQIRVHLKYISHPIVSDEKYVGRKMARYDKRWCPRLFLHAQKIGFYHPVKEKWMELESPLPEDLKKALEKLDE